jgi:TonB family protein
MKTFFTLAIFFVAITGASAQRQGVFFIKNNGMYVDNRDSADYTRVVRPPDSASVLFNVTEYYRNGTPKLIGKSSKLNPPQFEGECTTFYGNGKRQSVINYKNGVQAGAYTEFYPNGKLYRHFSFPENNTDRMAERAGGYLIMANNDSLGNAQVTDGNGYYKGYNDKFAYVEEEGTVKEGRRDGQWKGNLQKISTTFIETYNNGQLVNGTSTNKEGKVNSYTKSRWVSPQFDGGIPGFSSFLSANLKYPADARRNEVEGTVILRFVVEKDGSLTAIRISRSVAPALDAEAVRVLNKSPKWIPGTQFGEPIKVDYAVPITFKLQ